MRKLNGLNAKSIKKALKANGINVISCMNGKGTSKTATYITIDTCCVDDALSFFNELGIVSATGAPHTRRKSSRSEYTFGACFMSQEMYSELN